MIDETTSTKYDNTNSDKLQETPKKPLNITLVRLFICTLALTGLLFLRLQNPENFMNFSKWYKENVCYKNVNKDEIKENFENLISNYKKYTGEITAFFNDNKF